MSERFNEYETVLRTALSESKTALTSKGITVPETTKLRNVPALINQIVAKKEDTTVTVTSEDSHFVGTDIVARHTDGTEISKVVDGHSATFNLTKEGAWTIDINLFQQATLAIAFYLSSDIGTWDKFNSLMYNKFSCDITNPDGSKHSTFDIFREGVNSGSKTNGFYKRATVYQKGSYKVSVKKTGESSNSKTTTVNVRDSDREYASAVFHIKYQSGDGYTISDPNSQEQPGFDGQTETPQTEEQIPTIYIINSAGMTEEQINEILKTIDEMIEQKKTEAEINEFIEAMEAEYGQIR